MKTVLKISALVAVLFVAFSMVGCKNDSATTTAVFTGSDSGLTITLSCYTDNTWKVHTSGTVQGLSGNITCNYDDSTGTYTGNPAQDGECTVTVLKTVNDYTLLGLFLTATSITNENAPLETVENPTPETINIVNGSFTFDSVTFTRQ